MERRCEISFEGDYSMYAKKYYSVVIDRVCDIYYQMFPECFDQSFTVHITPNMIIHNGQTAMGEADTYNAYLLLQTDPSGYMALSTYASDIASHEIGHTILSRKTGVKQNGKYLPFTREGNDYVHVASNDYKDHNNSLGYYETKTYLEPALLIALKLPFVKILYIRLDKLLQDSVKINTMFVSGTQPTGPNEYYF